MSRNLSLFMPDEPSVSEASASAISVIDNAGPAAGERIRCLLVNGYKLIGSVYLADDITASAFISGIANEKARLDAASREKSN